MVAPDWPRRGLQLAANSLPISPSSGAPVVVTGVVL
jgi:hypothetical protein